jgi:hypothetical protein
VRNSEHALARERAILVQQKRDIIFGLSNATADVQRAFDVAQAQYNRFEAAKLQTEVLIRSRDEGRVTVDLVLEAQRRLLDTEILYHQATVDYVLAMRNVYYEKGTLLAFNNIFLNEGPSPAEAYHDAVDLAQRRTRPLDYVHRDITIGCGPVNQMPGPMPTEVLSPGMPTHVLPSEVYPDDSFETPPPAAPEMMPPPGQQTSLTASALETALDVAQTVAPPVALPSAGLIGFER